MKKLLKIVLALAAVLAAAAISYHYFLQPSPVQGKRAEIKVPMVTVSPAKAQSMHIPVYTRGTVTPSTQIFMVSEVSGQIVEISPNFSSGGFFKKGEVLLRVNPLEYDVAIKRAEASRAQAYQAFLQAQAEKKARSMGRSVQGNSLASFDVQVRQAEAHYLAANAELEAIKMQRDRTTVRAPFDGRVLTASLNAGQYLRPGMQMGVIYAVDVAEVRLPLSDRQLGLVDVPTRMSEAEQMDLPEVVFTEEFAGKTFTWKGKIVRAEGGVDERNRLLYVIAHVPDPYGEDPSQPGRPELVAGSFVEARIAGRKFERVFAIPRKALRHGSQVWVVSDDSRLSKREISIVHKAKDTVFVSAGIDDGDQVVLSQLDIAVEGMRVRSQVEEGLDQSEQEAAGGENPFASTRPVESAVSAPFQPAKKPAGVTGAIAPEQARELAEKAKGYYDGLSDGQKEKLKQNASKLAGQLGAMQDKLKQATSQQTAPVTQAQETVEPETTGQTDGDTSSGQQSAVDQVADPVAQPQPMSPLAEQLEQDMASVPQATSAPGVQGAEQPAQPASEPAAAESAAETAAAPSPATATPDTTAAAEQTPAPTTDTASDKPAASRGIIATVAAPRPLAEASQ